MFAALSGVPILLWNNFRNHSGSYGMGAASLVGATFIQRQWGMAVAGCFLAGVATNYPLIIGRIQVIPYFEINSVVQAATAIGLAALYYYAPAAAPLYIPIICSALALSILKMMIDTAKQRDEEDKRFQQQNSKMSTLEQSFKEAVLKIEAEVVRCFNALVSIEEIASQKDQIHETLDNIDEELSKRIQGTEKRLKAFAKLCEDAKSNNTVIQRMEGLQELTAQCDKQTQEIQKLTAQFEEIKRQLMGVLDELSRDAALSRENLLKIQAYQKKLEG